MKQNVANIPWNAGAVPLARNETHDQVIAMMEKEPRGKVVDVSKLVMGGNTLILVGEKGPKG